MNKMFTQSGGSNIKYCVDPPWCGFATCRWASPIGARLRRAIPAYCSFDSYLMKTHKQTHKQTIYYRVSPKSHIMTYMRGMDR